VFRERVAGFLLASRPGMSKTKALRLANITLEIIKALNRVYSEIHPQERASYVKEFKLVLFAYLRSRTETT
jgi:hypothetical protein